MLYFTGFYGVLVTAWCDFVYKYYSVDGDAFGAEPDGATGAGWIAAAARALAGLRLGLRLGLGLRLLGAMYVAAMIYSTSRGIVQQ